MIVPFDGGFVSFYFVEYEWLHDAYASSIYIAFYYNTINVLSNHCRHNLLVHHIEGKSSDIALKTHYLLS